MFTGIIQEIGKVSKVAHSGGNLNLEVEASKTASRLERGASVSINGACQTVVWHGAENFKVEAIGETLTRTNLGRLQRGAPVNLEMPLGLSDLLHGHLVQGHVDCTTQIQDIQKTDGSILYTFALPRQYERLLIEKGSIAVDGVSLTVVGIAASSFRVSVIPHTFENTIFKHSKRGDLVNLEFDMVAKYIQKVISPHGEKITLEFLKEHGF